MGRQSYLVDCNIVGGNPRGEQSKHSDERGNGVRNPRPKEGAAGNDHEELVSTHRPTVDRIYGTSGVQTVHDGASDESRRPL